MAKKSAIEITKKRAKALKKEGLIKYDLRRKLTPAQKSVITRKWKGAKTTDNKHHHGWGTILENDNIIKRTVKKEKAQRLKEMGYPVINNRVYIDTQGYEKVQIKGNEIIKTRGRKKVRDFIIEPKNILEELEHLMSKGKKPNRQVTVRIGPHSQFSKSFVSFQSLLNYVSNWSPKEDFDSREQLIDQMSIVEFT